MNIVETLMGRSMTPQEKLRKHQRTLKKAERELDRERMKLEQQEKKLVQDIKTSARKGQMSSCKIMAKDLVRTRRYVSKFYGMRTQIQAIELRLQTMRSNQQMADAMKGAAKSMNLMSRSMNLPQIQKIMMEFERESSMMDMKEEMMSDAVDDVMDDDAEAEEEEGDKILKEVLDEIGVSVGQQLADAPTGLGPTSVAESRQPVAVGEGGGGADDMDDLQKRLNSLRDD